MSLYVCIKASAESRSVFIVERKYVFTLRIVLKERSRVAVDTGIGRRMVIESLQLDYRRVKQPSFVNRSNTIFFKKLLFRPNDLFAYLL